MCDKKRKVLNYNNCVLSSLKIIHICHGKYSNQIVETIDSSFDSKIFIWKTCLRTIIFSKSEQFDSQAKYGQTYHGEDAYMFLLEVICGLHSKLIGETEILSQFKKFIKLNPLALSEKISNKLIQNSKVIRNKYLKDYGGQSYGSYVNSASKEYKHMVIIGAGALTQDILPIIKHSPIKITVKTRSIKKYAFLTDRYPHLSLEVFQKKEKDNLPTLLVIAAPLSSHELEDYVNHCYDNVKVLDMRPANHDRELKLNSSHQYQALNDIFNKLSKTHQKLKEKIPLIKQEIVSITKKWNSYTLQRPYGWDDLC